MNDIVRRMRFGLTMRFWLLGVISAAILTSAVACSDDPEPTSTSVPEPTATSVPTQADATSAPATATTAPPTATPEPEVEVIDADPLNIVATSNIVGDWVSIVGGDRVDVLNLVPRGVDPHGYQPGARDIARVADAEIVFAVGLSLEQQWLEDLIDNAAADHEVVIELGQRINPIEFSFEGGDDHGEEAEAMEHGEEEGATLTGRLLVGDADSDHLMVVDLMTEEISELDIGLPGPVSAIYASPNHRFGYAIYRGDEGDHAVHTIDGGVFLVPHGDHEDLVVVPVSEVGLTVNDERPIHFTNGGEWSAIFNDGTGRAALMNEHEIEEEGHAYEIPYLNTGLQHGAAVPIENDLFAVTVANPDYPDTNPSSLPIGVEIRNLDDEIVWDESREDCPGMHGEAHNHDGSAYGCLDGVLFIEQSGEEFSHWTIENHESFPEGARIGSVWGHEDSGHFFGKATLRGENGFEDLGIWMIDPEGDEMTLALAPSETKNSVSSAFSHDGSALYVLTYDGMLNVIDADDGDVIGEAKLTDPIDPMAAPRFIIVGETLFLSDQATQHVVAFDLDHMEVAEEWEVDGTPTSLAYVGIISSEDHPEEGHDHDAEAGDHDDEEAEAMEDEEHHGDEDEDAHGDEDEDAHGDEGEGHGDEDEDEDHAEDEVEIHHEHDGHDHGALDPHFWFDPDRVIIAVRQIAKELRELDPGSADYYNANRDEYIAKLEELDGWITDSVSAIDDHDRIMVTTHDAFGYFAARFGFEIAGVIIPGGGTELERSPQELAELVHEVEEAGASVVFAEAQLSDRLANTLAREAGIRFVGGLHVGSLSADGSGAESYLDLMRSNVGIIIEALVE